MSKDSLRLGSNVKFERIKNAVFQRILELIFFACIGHEQTLS